MPQTEFGPVNIIQGNSAQFYAEFFDSNGATSVPAGATLTVDYVTLTNVSTQESLPMTGVNEFFTVVWSSTSAALGLATWNLYVTGESTSVQTGQIRVITPG